MHRARCIFFGPFAAMPAGGRAGGFLLCADDRYTGSPFTLKVNIAIPLVASPRQASCSRIGFDP